MTNSELIGYLIAYPGFTGVCCQECLDGADKDTVKHPVSLYRINVYPYRQSCHGCGKTLVEPQTAIWPELFVKSTTFIDAVNAAPTAPVGEYYADLDEDTNLWCVFHSEHDHAYASYANEGEAKEEAAKRNRDRK